MPAADTAIDLPMGETVPVWEGPLPCDAYPEGRAPNPRESVTFAGVPALELHDDMPGIIGARYAGRYGDINAVIPDMDGDGIDEVASHDIGMDDLPFLLMVHTGAQLAGQASSLDGSITWEAPFGTAASGAADVFMDGKIDLLIDNGGFYDIVLGRGLVEGPNVEPDIAMAGGDLDHDRFGIGNVFGEGSLVFVEYNQFTDLNPADIPPPGEQLATIYAEGPPGTAEVYDVTGDGIDDVALTAQFFAGPFPRDTVFYMLDYTFATWTAISPWGYPIGTSSGGDTSGDGFDDLITGRAGSVQTKPAHIWMLTDPGTGAHTFDEAQTTFVIDTPDALTVEMDGRILGDMDGDGFDELTVRTSEYYGRPESLNFFFGPACGVLDVDADLALVDTSDVFTQIEPGDFDHDDLADLLIGRGIETTEYAAAAGRTYILYGADL